MKNIYRKIQAILVSLAIITIGACGEKQSEGVAPIKKTIEGSQTAMQIEVLTIKGCQVTPPTVELVKAIADEAGISYEISIITVENSRQANDLKFIGSPSVRINGVDIEPETNIQKNYGVT